jgi:hypothetical protein
MSTFAIPTPQGDTGTYTGDPTVTNADGTVTMVKVGENIDFSCKATVDSLLTALKTASSAASYTAFQTAIQAIPLP